MEVVVVEFVCKRVSASGSTRRAVCVGSILPLLLAVTGLILLVGWWPGNASDGWTSVAWRAWGGVLRAGGLTVIASLWASVRHPRLAYDNGDLLVNLRWGPPYRLPIEVVECFFLGQGVSGLRRQASDNIETRNVVVRLAERAKSWHTKDVKAAMGQWCNGYITIRGAWCEPLDTDTINRLNDRLRTVQRVNRSSGETVVF